MKTCKTCKKTKPKELFNKHNIMIDGYANICKKCNKKNLAVFQRSKRGVASKIYGHQLSSSYRRGHEAPRYTRDDLLDWLMSQKLFHHLFHLWEISNYDKYLKPSVDRKEDKLGYTFSNIQLMTWGENDTKANRDKKSGKLSYSSIPVSQYSSNGVLLAVYHSLSQAARVTGATKSAISKCCNNKPKHRTAGGFIWKYGNESADTTTITDNNSSS